MARAIWAEQPLRGSPWVLKYPYCHQIITQTHPRGNRRVSEKVKFYCLRQVHLAENLPRAKHTQNRMETT